MNADIIPAKKLPRNLSLLSYSIPKKFESQVKIGQIVSIPLRNSITTGVIVHISETKKLPYSLKNILNLTDPKPIFTQNQLKLFQELANYYHISASLFIHFNLPKLIKKDWQKLPSNPVINKPAPTAKSSYFWWPSKSERNKFYLNKIKKSRKDNSQLLIVVPRINDISNLAEQLKLKASGYVAVHRDLSRSQNFKIWLKAIGRSQSTNCNLFIGTRSSLFYPYTNLKTIIVDDEHSLDHKQYDMNPRYEVRIAAKLLTKINKSKIIYSSPSPSLESYQRYLPRAPKLTNKITLLNLENELAKKNFTFISEKLYWHIKQTLKNKKSIFLFVNKKGESSATICQDCNYIFTCPTCELPLILSKNHLVCYHCGHQEDFPPFCPKCSGPNLRSSGLGIQKIEKNLKKLFATTNIIRLDKDIKNLRTASHPPTGELPSPNKKNSHAKLLNKLGATIFIGTEFALDKIAWPKIGLLGVINADNLWHHTEFMASETAYQLLIKLLTLVPKNANIIIQTFKPDHYIVKSIRRSKPEIFYDQELKFRKKFDYPPFMNLIKLSYLNKSENKTKKEAQKLLNKLSNKLARLDNAALSPALPIVRRKIRGKFKYNIILKLKNIEDFKTIGKIIPNDWIIDIHPRTLLD